MSRKEETGEYPPFYSVIFTGRGAVMENKENLRKKGKGGKKWNWRKEGENV